VASDFSAFPVLITDRIVLRELRTEDAADLLVFRGDAEEQRFNSEPLQTLEQSVALIEEVRGDYAAQTGVSWALTLKSSGRVVGLFGYHHWDHYHRRADIGYDLARELWGQGLATEALTAAIRFGFSDMQLNRIEAQTIADNEPSTRLLGRLGFVLEGTRRSYSWEEDGTFHDGAIYGLLRNRS
jgi:ribosomal-protein-alanine N-acetyltransferase